MTIGMFLICRSPKYEKFIAMTSNRVCCLTPAATGAIATVALAGPDAWAIARELFFPAGGGGLPETPIAEQDARRAEHRQAPGDEYYPAPDGARLAGFPAALQSTVARFWYGRFGTDPGDDVILAYKPGEPVDVEIHCHGGRQVVRWMLALLQKAGCTIVEAAEWPHPPKTWEEMAQMLLPQARTLRTANILLDQAAGAFSRAVVTGRVDRLASFIAVGHHLLEPWKVAVAGEPNVGKSSLMNALAGYKRSVVAPIPGTTRDVVGTLLAFDGWPVELLDTAGLRDGADALEREGIEKTRQALASCDLCLWVVDASGVEPPRLEDWTFRYDVDVGRVLVVVNKVDLPPVWDLDRFPDGVRVAAIHETGIPELIQRITAKLVPDVPEAGEAVPFTPALCEWVERMQSEGRTSEMLPPVRF